MNCRTSKIPLQTQHTGSINGLPVWVCTEVAIGEDAQPLMTAIGLNLNVFLLMPASWPEGRKAVVTISHHAQLDFFLAWYSKN